MSKNITEHSGIAFTSAIKDGWQVSVTERAISSATAVANLEATIALMIKDGYVPFVSYYNKSETVQPVTPDQDYQDAMVSVAEELGGGEVPIREVAIPDGHTYLGVKSGQLEEIRENDSYQVLAETYSYSGGDWVNFHNGASEMSVAGHYYANTTGQKIFQEMFHWAPAQVEKAPIPGGNVLLYILGVKGKKSSDIYQNIKQVEPA